ncbi:MAG: AAA family ATPase [Steroidobacteraceae bacterium]
MAELIEALRDPSCYAHPVHEVDVRETHISWVLLTGEYAYKIKKPVQLAFVDFSTLERRRHFCEEEVRLNRRFAPQLYLDVVPITGTLDTPRVGGDGPVIEFAVRLKQFDPAMELAALVTRNDVRADALENFGAQLARIQADSCACIGDTKVWQTVQRNLQELKEVPQEVVAWLHTEYARLQPVLQGRGQAGRIRECHGDLHAGNVVSWHGELTAFDCIEFNPELRQIDVADDVAFLMMDLIARGRRDLAYAFAAGWLQVTGDYEATLMWRWFRVHRALVRTKVERLGDDQAAAKKYLCTALGAIEPRCPRLVLMCGMSGSGKTWLSTQLLQAAGAVRVRSDVERKRLAGLDALESSRSLPGQGIYTREFNERVYAHLLSVARSVLQAGEHVIIDAAFLRRDERASFIALARELSVEVTVVHCHAPVAELRARLLARRGDASEATVEVLERQAGYWEAFDDSERATVTELDTKDAKAVRRLLASAAHWDNSNI